MLRCTSGNFGDFLNLHLRMASRGGNLWLPATPLPADLSVESLARQNPFLGQVEDMYLSPLCQIPEIRRGRMTNLTSRTVAQAEAS